MKSISSSCLIFLINIFMLSDSFSQDLKSDTLLIFFTPGSVEISQENKEKVDNMLSKINSAYSCTFDILSCSNIVSDRQNLDSYTQKRALLVKEYLHQKGVPYNFFYSIETQVDTVENLPSHILVPNGSKVFVSVIMKYFEVRTGIYNFSLNNQVPESLEDILKNGISSLNKGDNIIIKGLNFQPGRHFLLNKSESHLELLLEVLQKYPNIKVEIQGHICCGEEGQSDGLDQDTNEYRLSYNRAEFVYNYLINLHLS